MHVISFRRLKEFWTKHPQAEKPLRAWHQVAERAQWRNLNELRATFPHADVVGKCIVFNVGGNKFRLVVVAHFNRGKLYVRKVMTHAEYSKGRWKDDCLGAP
jgi:mRNA interferase HigB